MATVYALGTNQNNWTKGSQGSIATMQDEDGYTFVVGLPTATTGRNVVTAPSEANSLEVAFCGGTPGTKARARIWALNTAAGSIGTSPSLFGLFLAEVEVTFGSTPYTGGILGATTIYIAHTIEVIRDATVTPPGIRFVGAIDPAVSETMAAMLFDSIGGYVFVNEMQNITGTLPGPIWRPV